MKQLSYSLETNQFLNKKNKKRGKHSSHSSKGKFLLLIHSIETSIQKMVHFFLNCALRGTFLNDHLELKLSIDVSMVHFYLKSNDKIEESYLDLSSLIVDGTTPMKFIDRSTNLNFL